MSSLRPGADEFRSVPSHEPTPSVRAHLSDPPMASRGTPRPAEPPLPEPVTEPTPTATTADLLAVAKALANEAAGEALERLRRTIADLRAIQAAQRRGRA